MAEGYAKFSELRSSFSFRLAPLAILVGIAAIAAPTLQEFYRTTWYHDQDTHGPIILACIIFAFWRQRGLFDEPVSRTELSAGLAIAAIGLIAYYVGGSQSFLQLEGAGLIVVVYGAILLAGGMRALKGLYYITALLLFVVPIPATLVDSALVPLKMFLSNSIVSMLSFFGYPIANQGVIISIGFEELQIADACAGLRSLVSLTAVGLLLIYFVQPTRRIISILLVAAIPFVALAANFVRVTSLVLVTYHLGSRAGTVFHDYAAYLEVLVAVAAVLSLHSLLEKVAGERRRLA